MLWPWFKIAGIRLLWQQRRCLEPVWYHVGGCGDFNCGYREHASITESSLATIMSWACMYESCGQTISKWMSYIGNVKWRVTIPHEDFYFAEILHQANSRCICSGTIYLMLLLVSIDLYCGKWEKKKKTFDIKETSVSHLIINLSFLYLVFNCIYTCRPMYFT